ncbi:MAG: glucosamine-6-phosphate deaminase [Clostridia bacterium]|nr:glucosamine-6-phosphate deaminase [Clostridia bacterium]
MNLVRWDTFDEMSRYAASLIAAQLQKKPDSVLGLATGSSPLGVYRRLIELYEAGEVDFSRAFTVNLDEYCGLPASHPESYARFMKKSFFDHINIKPENTYIPNGNAADPAAECMRYEHLIGWLGGIDLQLLGIGFNGHIGFNEPSRHFIDETHRVKLTASTLEANGRFFPDGNPPAYAITVGMKTIMRAKTVVLIAGEEKYSILKRAFTGPVTPEVPASILLNHPHATVIYTGGEEIR